MSLIEFSSSKKGIRKGTLPIVSLNIVTETASILQACDGTRGARIPLGFHSSIFSVVS